MMRQVNDVSQQQILRLHNEMTEQAAQMNQLSEMLQYI